MPISQRMKALRNGYWKGVPDLLVFTKSKEYCGLAIEMKTPRGSVSKEQREALSYLESQGWCTYVGNDVTKTKFFIASYFGVCKEPKEEETIDLTHLSTMPSVCNGKPNDCAT